MPETTTTKGLGFLLGRDKLHDFLQTRVFSKLINRSGPDQDDGKQPPQGPEPSGDALIPATTSLPSDPDFAQQWHLNNGDPGEYDLNVTGVWPNYTGDGVLAFVIDDGFDFAHPDLSPNYDMSLDYDFEGDDGNPTGNPTNDAHGTATMGLIGAVRNGEDVVGVAYDATLVGYRVYSFITNRFINQLADAIEEGADDGADLINMSLGSQYSANFFDQGLGSTAMGNLATAIDSAVDTGRGGLGTVLVKSAGNGRDDNPPHNANASSWNANFKTISVAATDDDGLVTFYSTPGANILISAFGSLSPGSIVTTDRVGSAGYGPGDVTTTFNGTSAAAPMVSGVVALMLEANPELGWRDVQEILANSARQVDGANSTWVENGADSWNASGLTHSVDYGFGLVDALAAVRLAETWQSQKTSANLEANSVDAPGLPQAVPDNDANGLVVTFDQDATIGRVEFATLTLDLPHNRASDLLITLTSPSGTTTTLLDSQTGNADHPNTWTYTAAGFRGEGGQGTWSLKIVDQVAGQTSTLSDATLTLHGDPPSDDDTYIFTDELSEVAAGNGNTASIQDGDGGRDIINAAAVESPTNLDLALGTGTLDGVALTVSGIEDVASGDGGDDLSGNAADNRFWSGRGDDQLAGEGGKDSLYGGSGADEMEGGQGDDVLKGGSGGDSALDGNSGRDTIAGDGGDDSNLDGGSRADQIDGGDGGDDFLYGGLGDDTLSGGSGNDGYFYGGAGLDTLSGDSGADSHLDGGVNADLIFGGDGDDAELLGDLANDLIYGGDGDDRTADGDRGGDRLYGGSGSDAFFYGDLSPDRLAGEEGDDYSFYGGAGNDSLFGGTGADSFFHGQGKRDTVYGGSGNDSYFYGGGGIDLLYGAEGDDAGFFGRAANDKIYGGDGDDSQLYGGNNHDMLYGDDGDDILYGDDGDDTATGGAGADSLFGGSGDDVFMVANQADFAGYLYDGGSGTDTLMLGAGITVPGSGTGLDSIEVTLS